MKNMYKTITGWLVMVAALTMGMTACTQDDSLTNDDNITTEPQPTKPETYTLSFEATMDDGGADTRALSLNGSTLDAMWELNQPVYVFSTSFFGSILAFNGTLHVTQVSADGRSATISGTLTTPPQKASSSWDNTILVNLYAAPINTAHYTTSSFGFSMNYSGQKGTLADIAAGYDYACAENKVVTNNSTTAFTIQDTPVTFQSKPTIAHFRLRDKDNGSDIYASQLTVAYPTMNFSITVNPDVAASDLYVALPAAYDYDVTLTATVGTNTYMYYKPAITLASGHYYDIAVKMQNMTAEPVYDTFFDEENW